MKFDICTCQIAPAGDLRNTVARDATNPVTWPEIQLLQHIHTPNGVFDIAVIGEADVEPYEEIARLRQKYGEPRVSQLFPGANPMLQPKVPKSVAAVPAPPVEKRKPGRPAKAKPADETPTEDGPFDE